MRLILTSFLFALLLCSCAIENTNELAQNPDLIAEKIKAGELGLGIAARANKVEKLKLQKISVPEIPYQIFQVEDYKGVYTFVLDKETLVLLCKSFGGYAHTFSLNRKNGKDVLYYKFNVGSGVSRTYDGMYIFGSHKAITKINPEQN